VPRVIVVLDFAADGVRFETASFVRTALVSESGVRGIHFRTCAQDVLVQSGFQRIVIIFLFFFFGEQLQTFITFVIGVAFITQCVELTLNCVVCVFAFITLHIFFGAFITLRV